MAALSSGRGVTQVMRRCEEAKLTGFLDLSDCSLMYLADAIYLVLKEHLTGIHGCTLKGNKLKKFPIKLTERFPNLTVLNLQGNEISSLPEEIGRWSSTLRGINLSHNQFTEFPTALYSLKSLALADLSHNQISTPIDFAQMEEAMPKLKQLHLTGNPIAAAEENAGGEGRITIKLE